MNGNSPIRTGLIGRGMAGTVFHAPLLRATKGVDLVGMAGAADAAALIADPSIDLIVIATPNETHAPLADAALRAGRHVVIDKPFALSSDDADRLIALADKRGLMLSVFHNRRWDGDFLTVRDLVATGRLGDVLLYEAYWDRFRPAIKTGWRESAVEGAGLLWDLGPHLIDQALALFGMPEAILADVATQREGAEADDYFHLTLHYGARRAILSATTMIADPRPRFALHGTLGSFRKYGLDPQEAALRDGTAPPPALDGTLVLPTGDVETVPTVTGHYRHYYEGVVDAIRSAAPPPVDPREARDVIRLIELAREPAVTGKRLTVRPARSRTSS